MPKTVWKGGAVLAPVPTALVTCADGGRVNVLTVAWTGIINSTPPKTYVSIRPERYSYDIIKKSGAFVINLTPKSLVRAADWCGVKSGRDFDKFKEMSLEHEPSPDFGIPMLCGCPVSIECRIFDTVSLGSHDMFMADIVSVCVDEQYIDPKGKLRLDKADIVAYSHGSYYTIGSYLGDFGFSVMKRKTAKRKQAQKYK